MAAEEPALTRPVDPDDIGKYAKFDGTDVVWDVPAGGGGGTPGLVGDLSAIEIGDAATAGTTGRYADAAHQHALPAPSAPAALGASAAAGASTAPARADHVHPYPTAAQVGAATSGHTHTGVYDPAGTAAAAVALHDADTSVHGIADTSALLDTSDIGVSVQGYSAVLAATTASFTTADETKLDGIEALADVTDETNVVAALSGATLTDVGTPASADKILLLDASDADNLKVAQFSTFGGGGATVDHPSIFASGEYQTPWGFGLWVVGGRTIGSTLENSNNLLMAYLHRTVAGATFDAMAINVQTAADATSNVLLAAYAADGIDGYPGTLIAEAGAVSITTTGTKVVTFSSPITPGAWFWAVMFTDVSGTVVPKLGGPASMYEYGWLPHDIESNTGNGPSHLFLSYTYPGAGSAPATFPAGATQRNVANATGGAFYVAMRKA